MASLAQVTVFLGTLTGIMIIFNALPNQYNAKIWAYALFHLLTVLVLFASIATQRFSNIGVGILALLAAAATLVAGAVIYRDKEQTAVVPFTGMYLVLEVITIVLVFGAVGLGGYS